MKRIILVGVSLISCIYPYILYSDEWLGLSCEEFQHIMQIKYNDTSTTCNKTTNNKVLKKKEKKKEKPIISSNCSCDSMGGLNCMYTLMGYDKGKFEHPKNKVFVQTILSEIHQFKDIDVFNIEIKGVADGTPNMGTNNWNNVISECKKDKIGTLNDEDLANLRACYIMYEINNNNTHSSLTWNNSSTVILTSIDHPDGFNIGSQYRKTEFKYSVLGSCNE